MLRAIPDGSAHLTCLFSGDAEDSHLGALEQAVRDAVAGRRTFDIGLGPPRVLLVGPRPRLACADVVRGGNELTALTADLREAVERARLPLSVSASRSPHVTLARFSKRARRSDAEAVSRTLEGAPWAGSRTTDRIASVQVIVSTLTPAGPVYEVRAQCALAARC